MKINRAILAIATSIATCLSLTSCFAPPGYSESVDRAKVEINTLTSGLPTGWDTMTADDNPGCGIDICSPDFAAIITMDDSKTTEIAACKAMIDFAVSKGLYGWQEYSQTVYYYKGFEPQAQLACINGENFRLFGNDQTNPKDRWVMEPQPGGTAAIHVSTFLEGNSDSEFNPVTLDAARKLLPVDDGKMIEVITLEAISKFRRGNPGKDPYSPASLSKILASLKFPGTKQITTKGKTKALYFPESGGFMANCMSIVTWDNEHFGMTDPGMFYTLNLSYKTSDPANFGDVDFSDACKAP